MLALCKASDALVGQPTKMAVTASKGAGNIGTATIIACVVPYDGTAPYVSGVNNLGTPSALITESVVMLVAGGTQQVAVSPWLYDDFELNNLVRWFPGPATYANVTNALVASGSGGSASVTTGAGYKDTGTYGAQLTAVSPNDAASIHHSSVAALAAIASAKPIQSSHCRFKVQTETSNTAAGGTDLRGFAHWVKFGAASPQLAGLATLDGTNWGLYLGTNPTADGVALATQLTLKAATFTLGAGFHDSEVTCDVTDGNYVNIRLTVDGVPQGGTSVLLASSVIQAFGSTACATSPVNTTQATETFYIDAFSIVDGGYLGTGASVSSYAFIYTWTLGANDGGVLFKYNSGSVWNSIDVGNVSTYTLTTLLPTGVTVNSPPPTTSPALVGSQIRASVGYQANATPTLSPGAAKNFRLGNSKREWLDLGGFSLGDRPRWEQANLPWLVQIEGSNPNGSTTIDVEAVALIDEAPTPQKGMRAELTLQANVANEEWDLDLRPDMEASCVLRSLADSSVDGEAATTGGITLAPGGNWLVALLSEQDGSNNAVGDAVNLEADVTVTVQPTFDISAGA